MPGLKRTRENRNGAGYPPPRVHHNVVWLNYGVWLNAADTGEQHQKDGYAQEIEGEPLPKSHLAQE